MEGQKIFLFPKASLKPKETKVDSCSKCVILELDHPKYGPNVQATYLIIRGQIHELQKVTDKTSAFVEGSVVCDGQLHIVSKIDPLFLLLKLLRRSQTRSPSGNVCFVPADQLCSVTDIMPVLKAAIPFLGNICDFKEYPEDEDMEIMYRLSEKKVQEWIKKKVRKIRDHFLNDCMEQSEYNEKFFTKQAIGILSEYLCPEDLKSCCQAFNFTLNEVNMVKKRKRSLNPEEMNKQAAKAQKIEAAKSVNRVSKTDRALQKMDKRGLRSIMSFFGKR